MATPHAPLNTDPTTSHRGRVLVVDDEPQILKSLQRVLGLDGHEVVTAPGGTDALRLLELGGFDVVLCDLRMPGLDGLQLTAALRARDLDTPVILMTGNPELGSAVGAVARGAFRYLEKPVDAACLRSTVGTAVSVAAHARARREALARAGFADDVRASRVRLELRFQSALDALRMAYQPIVRWSTREVVAYEGLLRTGEASLANPAHFFEAAETLGRVSDVSRLVFSRVGEPFVREPTAALLFVNIHATDLANEFLLSPDCPLTRIASRVVLEITERASLEVVKDAREWVGRLRAAGYRIALDDIGAGYAGLSSLALLEPEVVKIDMSLIRDIDREPTKRKLVGSLARMCSDLTQLVVAEGVESAAERDCLADLGIDLLQGYLFARPAPPFPPVLWGS